MSKTKDVQEQVEEILQEQISLLRRRAKECSRQFNHQIYDDLTAQYLVLEKKLRTLIAPTPKTENLPESYVEVYDRELPANLKEDRNISKPAILGAPYEAKNAIPLEDAYERLKIEVEPSNLHSDISRLPEIASISGSGNSGSSQVFNWGRIREHHS